jgi:hypothetical protein
MLAGCGGSTSNGGVGAGDMAMGPPIPDPGMEHGVDNDFKSAEPNDSPATATPLGVASTNDVSVWVNSNSIGGGDTTDYFVFKSGSGAGQFSFGFSGICWMGAITHLDAKLWKVAGGQQVLPPVHEWMSDTSCLKSAPGDAPMEASTVYLLGLTATGGAGTYSA